MKMREYSVLFVCALCVFVLCGVSAFVIAQRVTPEKVAAKEARDIANMARERGDNVLDYYKTFEFFVGNALSAFFWSVDEINTSKGIADTLSLPAELPSKEDIKDDIKKFQRKMMETRNAVDALIGPGVDSLSNQSTKDELRNKMTDVLSKVRKVGQAAAAVTERNISTIDVAIERAVELQAAAKGARDFWDAAVRTLATQMGMLCTVGTALNTVKNQIENATKKFANNKSPETLTLNVKLRFISTVILAPAMRTLTSLKTWLQTATNVAEIAKNKYRELAAKAEELKGKAEERKRKVQIRHLYDTNVYGPPNK